LRLATSPVGLTWSLALGVLAGELLAFIVPGLLLSLFTATEPRPCRVCGQPVTLRGRHFTSSHNPHWTDIALLVAFGVINLAAWVRIDL
jgi:hypothetical protein